MQKRLSANERGYTSRWARYSKIFRRNNPLCVDCKKRGILTPSRHVDHIKAVSGPDDPLFWDPENHQPLCESCHAHKTATEDGGFGHDMNKTTATCDTEGMPTDNRHPWNRGGI